MGKEIESCLLDWGIKEVTTITVDNTSVYGNASVYDGAIDYVRRKLKGWSGNAMLLDGEFLCLGCCTKVVNSIVAEGLKDMHDSIASIRNAVRYVRIVSSGRQKFRTCVEHENIEPKGFVTLDVPGRWDSIYLMLVSALIYQKAFERMKKEDTSYVNYFLEDEVGDNSVDEIQEKLMGPPTKDDWKKAQAFVTLLKIFYDVTSKFKDPRSGTSNTCFCEMLSIGYQLTNYSQSEDPLLNMMATDMKTKFEMRWGPLDNINKLLFISVVLDPRLKLSYLEFCFGEMYDKPRVAEMMKEVKELFSHFYESYNAFKTSSDIKASNDQSLSETTIKIGEDKDDYSLMSGYKKFLENQYGTKLTNEVEKYLLTSSEGPLDGNFDPLNWWKEHSAEYRILSQIAKELLSIPVSAIPSEFSFNSEGRILDLFQTSLGPKMLQAVICLQNWLHCAAAPADDFTEDMEFDDLTESEFWGSRL